MTRSKMFSFRVHDLVTEQQLDAMADRSDFIRRAVIEKLSADAVDREAVRRLRAGLASIANSTELILDAGGNDVPELVRVGLIGIREAAAILAADPQAGERAEPEKGAAMAAAVAQQPPPLSNRNGTDGPQIAAQAGASPPQQSELPLCASEPDARADPEPDPSKTNLTPPIQEDHP